MNRWDDRLIVAVATIFFGSVLGWFLVDALARELALRAWANLSN